jgi:hypothetical protein
MSIIAESYDQLLRIHGEAFHPMTAGEVNSSVKIKSEDVQIMKHPLDRRVKG